MKHAEAVAHLRTAQLAVQRARSILRETDQDEEFLAFLNPWLFGDKSILRGITMLLDRVDNGGWLDPQEFYNVMYVLNRPDMRIVSVNTAAGSLFGRVPDEFPEPDMQWLRGWSPEGSPE